MIPKGTKNRLITLLLASLLFLRAGFVFSQDAASLRTAFFPEKFQIGMSRYQESRWLEAAAEFRAAQEASGGLREWTEALYWVILSEMAASDFGSALQDMEALEKGAAGSGRAADLVYHRAWAYYSLGYYEEALPLFRRYADSAGPGGESRKAAALYWMGECLYALGQLDKAAEFFNTIVTDYPGSPKYDASVYRIDLIKQKKIETELLALLKWSHEESLRTAEEYQRKERTYEQAMNAYQRRIAELLKDTRVSDLENANAEYRRKLADAEARIQALEAGSVPADEELRQRAQQLRNEIQWDLNNLENGGTP
jgi:TolA-binding protein